MHPPVACGCELEGWGVVDRLEACGVVRPSDLEVPLAAGGSSRSPGQLEAPWVARGRRLGRCRIVAELCQQRPARYFYFPHLPPRTFFLAELCQGLLGGNLPEWLGASWDKRAVSAQNGGEREGSQEHGGPSMMETPGASLPASGMM